MLQFLLYNKVCRVCTRQPYKLFFAEKFNNLKIAVLRIPPEIFLDCRGLLFVRTEKAQIDYLPFSVSQSQLNKAAILIHSMLCRYHCRAAHFLLYRGNKLQCLTAHGIRQTALNRISITGALLRYGVALRAFKNMAAFNKFSQTVNMAIAAVMYIIGFGAFSLVTDESNLWITLVATAIWTAGETLISTGSGVFIGGRAPEEHRAAFQSLFEVFGNLGRCIGPVSMGYFLTGFSYQTGWVVVSGVCVLMMLIMLIAIHIDKGERTNE